MIKRWNGKSWVDHRVRRWNGKAWVNAVVKRWNGKAWVVISEERKVKTWECTWTHSFGGANSIKPNYLGGKSLMYQGRYGAPDSNNYDWGRQKSMAGFDWRNIQAELAGARIEKVEIYLHNQHFWYFAGGRAFIGQHNSATAPNTFSQSKYGIANIAFSGRGQAQWITLPNSFAEDLKAGRAKGFTLYRNSDELSYYGYWYGKGSGWRQPKIRITYHN